MPIRCPIRCRVRAIAPALFAVLLSPALSRSQQPAGDSLHRFTDDPLHRTYLGPLRRLREGAPRIRMGEGTARGSGPDSAPGGLVVSVDAPDAGGEVGQGTVLLGVNASGAVTGTVTDGNNLVHGFVRSPEGEFSVFDAPGTADYTVPTAINDQGVVAGYLSDTNSTFHGFIRRPDGSFLIVDAPGAGSSADPIPPHNPMLPGGDPTWGTLVTALDSAGDVAGYYLDPNAVYHGFIRTAEGSFHTFEAPQSAVGYETGTQIESLNNLGAVTGRATDAAYVGHGFVLSAPGQFVEITPPGGLDRLPSGVPPGTIVDDLAPNIYANDGGVLAGSFPVAVSEGAAVHAGFVRDGGGGYTVFRIPDGTTSGGDVVVNALNIQGAVTGDYDTNSSPQCFVRTSGGGVETPGFPPNEAFSSGTAMNAAGVVVGWWSDASDLLHGFIWSKDGSDR